MKYYQLALGNIDVAEPFAVSAVERWAESDNRRHAVLAEITLAIINVQAGEPCGAPLAHRAITSVAELRSVRARERLGYLAAALETRPSSGNRDLAVLARRVAAQRV